MCPDARTFSTGRNTPLWKFAAEEAAMTGTFRQSHSRLSEYAEEIAFLGGEDTEKMLIERNYYALAKHISRVLRIRIWHGIVEEGIIKYVIRYRIANDLTV